MTAQEIKPCPFCGRRAEKSSEFGPTFCSQCGAMANVKVWNRRSTEIEKLSLALAAEKEARVKADDHAARTFELFQVEKKAHAATAAKVKTAKAEAFELAANDSTGPGDYEIFMGYAAQLRKDAGNDYAR